MRAFQQIKPVVQRTAASDEENAPAGSELTAHASTLKEGADELMAIVDH